MNERIDQLMVKAGAYFGGEGVVYDTFDPKKFAELIIQDCDRYARSTWEHGHLLGGDLKRLFGFEEEE